LPENDTGIARIEWYGSPGVRFVATTQRYSVQQPPIQTLFTWIHSCEIAIPEIQRPFVWNATKVRNFLDSLFQGFPVGFLIAWKNPDVKLKDGSSSTGKTILIDGQQRVTALMAALLGREVVDKDYRQVRIKIAFHPGRGEFEVHNPAIAKDAAWIPDIAPIFDAKASMFDQVESYCQRNPGTSKDEVFRSLERLKGITSNQIGLIQLDHDLEIETVTEIFIRVNSAGVPLSQADFAMSKIAVNETYGGNTLRKAIDYFCHLAVAPEFFTVMRNDTRFAASDFLPKLTWLKDENDTLYDPSYTDMLRVAFTSEFRRGRLEDLVALLSGRNFETRQYEERIIEESFATLKQGILRFMNENHYKSFLMIFRSAGFVDASLIRSQNTLNFAYILYLTLRAQKVPNADIERYVRRWFVMSILTGRYSGSPETEFDRDIRQIHAQGIHAYAENVFRGELSSAFWETLLPDAMDTSVASSPYFCLYQAAQVKLNDLGFLSRDIRVHDLLEVKSDVHHIFPRDFLKRHGVPRGQYNQIANYVVTQSEINIAIGNKDPATYFAQIYAQCNGGPKLYGNITDLPALAENFRMNCIPEGMRQISLEDYPSFLVERRKLMADRLRIYFESL
jgi:hypothetical protein